MQRHTPGYGNITRTKRKLAKIVERQGDYSLPRDMATLIHATSQITESSASHVISNMMVNSIIRLGTKVEHHRPSYVNIVPIHSFPQREPDDFVAIHVHLQRNGRLQTTKRLKRLALNKKV